MSQLPALPRRQIARLVLAALAAVSLFRAGRDFESLPLPGVTHMYTSDPVVMERLWARTATFFRKHLGEPK